MSFLYKLAIVVVIVVLQGCASTDSKTTNKSALSQLVISEPMSTSYKSELALARLTEILQRAEITDAQKAQLYYDRGVIYDSVGLRSLSRIDFSRALSLKPDLVDAYNFIGIQFIQLQEFNQAYDSFDSAIELAPDHKYAYLNRGIALYYGSRPSLAAKDFMIFHREQTDDPYRLLWLYLAEYKLDAELAKSNLRERSQEVSDQAWAKNIISLYLGEMSQEAFIEQLPANIKSNKDLSDRLCEAYFYLGKHSQMLGDDRLAMTFYKLALGTNVYEFVEHRYAKLELDLIRQSYSQNTPL